MTDSNAHISPDLGLLPDHPQRYALHNEIHARPPIPLWSNERVISQAFLLDQTSRKAQTDWINRCATALGSPTGSGPHSQSIQVLQLAKEPARVLLKWEMHGEFVSISLFAQQQSADIFDSRQTVLQKTETLLQQIGAPSLTNLAGQRMVALDIVLERGEEYPDAFEVAKRFSGNTVIGSLILSNQNAQLWTDLQLDAQGFVSMIVRGKALGSRQAGRAIQRLIDIETYRMMALLALPYAKAMSEPLRKAEVALAELSDKIAQAQKHAEVDVSVDSQLLSGISALAAEVEGWISANGLRFTAAEAYQELVKRSLTELHETTIPGVQMLNTFMDRRFEPAMRTCRWTARRLRDLSDRISRTTHILKTRIEFVNESQTQTLLSSMDRRAKLQLRLQQTVEGLSVIVMTYYATGLIQYLAKGAKAMGLPTDPDLVALISVPLVAGSIFWILGRRRKKHPLQL
jgi:uncharacterized membrane-anchored protein